MEGLSNALLSVSNINVSNFVTVKLSGNHNYLLWRAQMLCLLDSNNLCGIVDATFVGPRDSGSEIMRQYDSLIRGWIFGSVSEDVLAEVYNLGSAKVVWEKLKSIYDPTICLQEEKEDIDDVSPIEEGTNLIEIIVGKHIVTTETQTKNGDMQKSENKIKKKKRLRAATIKGDWLTIESILKNDEGLVTAAISSDGSTILHIAVGISQNDIVKKMFSFINDKQILKKRDSDGSTALHIAAIVGNKAAAALLVKKNNKLLQIKDHKGEQPLHRAYENMHLDTIGYLLKAVNGDGKTELQSSVAGSVHPGVEIGVDLLVNAISAKQYTLALELVPQLPKHASKSDQVLMAIAKSFPRGMDYWEEVIPRCIFFGSVFMSLVAELTMASLIYKFIPDPYDQILSMVTVFPVLLIWKKGVTYMLGSNRNKFKEGKQAKKVLELVCDEIDKLDFSGTHHPFYTEPFIEAACQNAHKVVDEILFRSPEVIHSTDKNGFDIIQLAIMHRSEKIYNLIYDIGERKNLYRTYKDSSENNILHLAGRRAPPSVINHRTGAALQLQRELQWREEVKKLVIRAYITQENSLKETPDMVFTREHEHLVKEAEKWKKTTAESCSIIAALITTVVFAAAITVPGGSNGDNGTPVFNKKVAFIFFAISDAISLFASSTTILVFLSILTTRFAEKDFLVSLPRRLFIGLFSLLVSTIAMMVAFSATLFLVFCDKKKPWMLLPISGLAFIPIALFVTLQFPLIVTP